MIFHRDPKIINANDKRQVDFCSFQSYDRLIGFILCRRVKIAKTNIAVELVFALLQRFKFLQVICLNSKS